MGPDDEERALLHFLGYRRASVLAIVEDLAELAWHTPVVPSVWTPAGIVAHLGDVERYRFEGVVAGSDRALPWDEGRAPYSADGAFTCDRSSREVPAHHRDHAHAPTPSSP